MKSRGFPLLVMTGCLVVSLGTLQIPAGSVVRNVAQRLSIHSLDEMRGDLSGVACNSSGDCQVVGAFAVPDPKHSIMAVLRTSDGGAAWVKEALPRRSGELNDVTCVSSSSCWSVGSTGGFTIPRILRTTDGGAKWSLQSVALQGEPMAISCGSTRACVAGGVLSKPKGHRILAPLVTHDGGRVWTASQLASWMAGVSGVSCPSPTICEVVGSWNSSMNSTATIGRSDNGGRSWIQQESDLRAFNTNLASVSCTSASVCEAVGSESGCSTFMKCPGENVPAGGLVLRTSDGGTHWSRQGVPKSVKFLRGVWCTSSRNCEAVGLGVSGYAVAIHTADGGATWSIGSVPHRIGFLTAVSCESKEDCLAVGFRGGPWPHLTIEVIRTTDGGVKWS
jgi:photosystem II stability/assembly factor-like uncharacterized protein